MITADYRREWTRVNRPGAEWVLSTATDTPFFSCGLTTRLLAGVEAAQTGVPGAFSGGQAHPVFGLLQVRFADELRRALVVDEVRKIDAWTARHRLAVIDFLVGAVGLFFNTNRLKDLAEAERLFAGAAVDDGSTS